MDRRNFIAGATASAGSLAFAAPAQAQLGGLLGRLAGRVLPGAVRNDPITSSLSDARWSAPERDGFTPRQPAVDLTTLPRSPNGGFMLRQGYFEMTCQSYCLKAGTHGPGAGAGYLYAPPIGPAEDAVRTISQRSVNFPTIAQKDIQTLLWAILARAKFEDLSTQHKAVAAQLLSPRQIATLNRSALDVLTGPALSNMLGGLPEPVRKLAEVESKLRSLVTSGGSFADMERLAVLSGRVPVDPNEVPEGRWSHHPAGFDIRYLPITYHTTKVQIWVPAASPGIGAEYDPAQHIAMPGNTARQRLLQSARPQTGNH